MKNFLTVLGIIFLMLVVGVVAIVGSAAYFGSKLDASSKTYVDENVPAIISSWSKAEFIKRASPQLLQKISDDQISELFATLSSKLGAFRSYDGAKGESNMSFIFNSGQTTTASYVAEATFQNGKAKIQIKLIRDDDSWKILGFNVQGI